MKTHFARSLPWKFVLVQAYIFQRLRCGREAEKISAIYITALNGFGFGISTAFELMRKTRRRISACRVHREPENNWKSDNVGTSNRIWTRMCKQSPVGVVVVRQK